MTNLMASFFTSACPNGQTGNRCQHLSATLIQGLWCCLTHQAAPGKRSQKFSIIMCLALWLSDRNSLHIHKHIGDNKNEAYGNLRPRPCEFAHNALSGTFAVFYQHVRVAARGHPPREKEKARILSPLHTPTYLQHLGNAHTRPVIIWQTSNP